MTTKEQAYRNLLDFKIVMEELELPFFLMEGTLLGIYTTGDIFDGDEDDIDIGMMEEYYTTENMDAVTRELEAMKFQVAKTFVDPKTTKLEGMGFKRGMNHIDVFAIHIKDDKAYMLARGWGRPNFPPIIAYVYPVHCFQKFAKIRFLNTRFDIPSDVRSFLSARYGDWRTYKSRAEYDSHDPKQCPCIRTEW